MRNDMKNSILILACIFQSYSFVTFFSSFYNQWGDTPYYLMGVPTETAYPLMIMWYIVFSSISLYFSGELYEKIHGFGKYILVRNYNKKIFLLKFMGAIAIKLLFILAVQTFIYYLTMLIIHHHLYPLKWMLLFKSFSIYYITMMTLVLLQIVLELYITPQVTFLIINMYVVFSILLAGLIFEHKAFEPLLYILIPNFMMGLRTDVINQQDFIIWFNYAILFLFIYISIIVCISLKKIMKKDFY
ncbi:DUF2705 family protein [Priestia aryabhattai]|uniref:DUF2705 family protein n=1 Tax=Priestia aryabhattai TaxID=412384 RepID=UPI001ADA9746|nr:DUF2705 family protein [Priestia aryabhattai]QTL52610.1 DUF2705 family protein [Priestia aryabhattai]